jgi:hypothetical protein
VELATGEFFLRWDERHPELPSAQEYLGEAYWHDQEKRLAYLELYDVLPSKRREIPLTRLQAFALVVAVSIPARFEPDIDALLGDKGL